LEQKRNRKKKEKKEQKKSIEKLRVTAGDMETALYKVKS
jgi:hypothetical protein